jgi:hypothetical protein
MGLKQMEQAATAKWRSSGTKGKGVWGKAGCRRQPPRAGMNLATKPLTNVDSTMLNLRAMAFLL